jgi:hypothetical protein
VVGDTLVFEIPPRGVRGPHVVAMLIGLAVPVVVYLVFVRAVVANETMPPGARLALLVFLGFFFMLLPAVALWGAALRSALCGVRVEVSPRELRVTRRGLLWSRSRAIPTEQLEELEVVSASRMGERQRAEHLLSGGRVLMARSDEAVLVFGAGLGDEELAWMRSVVWNVVSA